MMNFRKIFLLYLVLLLTASSIYAQAVEINVKPLNDFADSLNEKSTDGKLDLTQPFAVELKGALDHSGKLAAEKSSFVRAAGDEQLIDIAKRAIEAINDAGFFLNFKQLNLENVNLSVSQDEREFSVVFTSDSESEETIRTIVTGLDTIIKISQKSENISADEKTILNATKVKSENKKLTLNVTLPKAVFQEMVAEKLLERKIAKQRELKKVK